MRSWHRQDRGEVRQKTDDDTQIIANVDLRWSGGDFYLWWSGFCFDFLHLWLSMLFFSIIRALHESPSFLLAHRCGNKSSMFMFYVNQGLPGGRGETGNPGLPGFAGPKGPSVSAAGFEENWNHRFFTLFSFIKLLF